MRSSAMSISETDENEGRGPRNARRIVPYVIHSVNKTGGYTQIESLSTYRKAYEKS